MIHSVFELGDTVVREVMVPRTDMVTIDARQDAAAGDVAVPALGLLADPGRRRRPATTCSACSTSRTSRAASTPTPSAGDAARDQHAMRPVHYVPESKPVDDLLREMQRDQSHFAIVVDEYGGTAGPGHHRGHPRGDRRRDRRRVRPRGARCRAARATARPACPATHGHRRPRRALRRRRSTRRRSTPSAACSARPSGASRSSGSPVRGRRACALTAERMAGRRHRIATVIVRPPWTSRTGPAGRGPSADRGRGT